MLMCRIKPSHLIYMVAMTFFSTLNASGGARELVSNPMLKPSAPDGVASDWSIWRPDWAPAGCRIGCTQEGVLMEAGKEPLCGGWCLPGA